MGKVIPFADQTPKSFNPEDWDEVLKAGGYWYTGKTLSWWVPVRDTDAREALIKRSMKQHGLTRREAIEALQEAGY
jgi:hypothetical protein